MRKRPKGAARKRPRRSVTLGDAQARWLASLVESIAANGGPHLTGGDVVHALIDASTGRSIDPASIRSLDDLRVAFGAPDLSPVERLLEERPRLEAGVLDALKDAIK